MGDIQEDNIISLQENLLHKVDEFISNHTDHIAEVKSLEDELADLLEKANIKEQFEALTEKISDAKSRADKYEKEARQSMAKIATALRTENSLPHLRLGVQCRATKEKVPVFYNDAIDWLIEHASYRYALIIPKEMFNVLPNHFMTYQEKIVLTFDSRLFVKGEDDL